MFNPPKCIVMPTFSEAFVSRIQTCPPISSPFKNADDFKLYWFKSHGYIPLLHSTITVVGNSFFFSLLLPDNIEHYAQVRLNDMELTYPACCLWDSKLMEQRSRQADPSTIVTQLLDDLKSIQV